MPTRRDYDDDAERLEALVALVHRALIKTEVDAFLTEAQARGALEPVAETSISAVIAELVEAAQAAGLVSDANPPRDGDTAKSFVTAEVERAAWALTRLWLNGVQLASRALPRGAVLHFEPHSLFPKLPEGTDPRWAAQVKDTTTHAIQHTLASLPIRRDAAPKIFEVLGELVLQEVMEDEAVPLPGRRALELRDQELVCVREVEPWDRSRSRSSVAAPPASSTDRKSSRPLDRA